eukprot:TRINITY_DN7293_c0_g3_i1.p1 TRINITY_DN7293_c0_g3~~TRINITY_DN7293_c0_g3_i1.p1  ORF type:complete len:295 (-),score=119.79 TRINITY_DN7293_c0_g3_i1:318-1202(-)
MLRSLVGSEMCIRDRYQRRVRGTPVKMSLSPSPSDLDREGALYMAKLAEQAERYEDMVKYMRRIVELGIKASELSVEERNLLSVGYKNMMSVRRTAWRTVQQYLEKNMADDADAKADKDRQYSLHISQEVFRIIDEVRDEVVAKYVSGMSATDNTDVADIEVLVFFKKMEGDYNRYGAEITEGDDALRAKYKEAAQKAYSDAQECAQKLPSTNPIRLGLALNFSVFHYEICDEKTLASEIAKGAFDCAIDHLDTLGDDEYKDSTLIMQLLKDNLTLWNADNEDDANDLQVEDVE